MTKKNIAEPMKQSKIFTQQPKPTESRNFIDIISVTIKHPETSHKLFRAIRQDKNVSQIVSAGKKSTSPLHIETTKCEKLLDEENAKITKRSNAYKGSLSSLSC